MGYFNYILYILRQLFKFKVIGIILLIMFSFIVFCLCLSTDVKALTTDEDDTLSSLYSALSSKISIDYNVQIGNEGSSIVLLFYDFNTETYNLVHYTGSLGNIGGGVGSDTGYFYYNMWLGRGATITCYRYNAPISYTTDNDGNIVATTTIGSSYGTPLTATGSNNVQYLNNWFNLKCFQTFCYLKGWAPTNWTNYSGIVELNSTYGKVFPQCPYLEINNGSLDFDGYLHLNPGNCYFNNDAKFQFYMNLYLIGDNEEVETQPTTSLFCNFSTYWDNTDLIYKIPIETLNYSLLNGRLYTIKFLLFGSPSIQNDFYYETFVGRTIKWNDFSYGINTGGGGGTDEPSDGATIDDINNTITDSTVDNSFLDDLNGLGFSVQDNSGIDNLFTILYNAFCSDTIQDVTITIPFVNKTFTISAQTVSNFFPVAVRSIVGVFVWGVVGLWVLKDIRKTVDKIREGNPENSGSDIKTEVL